MRQGLEHQGEYPSLTAAAAAVACREGLARRPCAAGSCRPRSTGGQRKGATSDELAEIKQLKAKVRRLEEDNDVLRRASIFFAAELDPRNR